MADWINQNCPKIEIKEDNNNIKINNSNNNETLQINVDFISNKSQLIFHIYVFYIKPFLFKNENNIIYSLIE